MTRMQEVVVRRAPTSIAREARSQGQAAALDARVANLEAQLSEARVNLDLARQQFTDAKTDAQRKSLSSTVANAEANMKALRGMLDAARAEQIAAQVAGNVSRVVSGVGTTVASPAMSTAQAIRMNSDLIIGGLMTVFVLGPLAIAFAVRLVRRGVSAPSQPPELSEMNERVRRIENAVDTIAVEVERVQENQRYIAKSLPKPDGIESR